jgi:hypothetical protein
MDKIDRILNKMNNKNKIKNAKLIDAENDYKLIDQNRRIDKLKQEAKNDFWIKVKGYLILAYVVLGTISTISISIAGGMDEYKNKFIFGLAVFTVQTGLFLLTMNETIIKKNYPDYIWILKVLQLGLLVLSIKFNYNFFTNHSGEFNVFTLLLCICFDVTILKSVAISSDFRQLNFHKNNNFDFENMGFLKMVWFNITAKYRINTLRAFNYNKAQFNKIKTEIEKIEDQENPLLEKDKEILNNLEGDLEQDSKKLEASNLLLLDDYKKSDSKKSMDSENKKDLEYGNTDEEKDRELLLNAIFENKNNDNVCPSVNTLTEITGMTRNKISKIKKELVSDGILTTNGTRTIVNIDSLEKLKN